MHSSLDRSLGRPDPFRNNIYNMCKIERIPHCDIDMHAYRSYCFVRCRYVFNVMHWKACGTPSSVTKLQFFGGGASNVCYDTI